MRWNVRHADDGSFPQRVFPVSERKSVRKSKRGIAVAILSKRLIKFENTYININGIENVI